MSGKEMAKIYEKEGYVQQPRKRGSHIKFKKTGHHTVTIPDHPVLDIGIEKTLLKMLNKKTTI